VSDLNYKSLGAEQVTSGFSGGFSCAKTLYSFLKFGLRRLNVSEFTESSVNLSTALMGVFLHLFETKLKSVFKTVVLIHFDYP